MPGSHAITEVLLAADADDRAVADRLVPLVYEELRRMAHGQLARERRNATLDTTALVHEAYLKLVDQTRVPVRSRAYFFGAAARAMRQVLVDRARHRLRQKRGGRAVAVTLDEAHLAVDGLAADLLDLDAALDRLAALDPRAAHLVECRYFGGLSVEETADVLGVTTRTLRRDWATARAWLYRALHAAPAP
ncbi:ECF-type sigma factor [Rubrivirga sp. IMCC45206]|uniref:ECF-type sigma factor n=1 Tax=Rubrivirga sp. IMCC45206 TaxID=3391614 RepID=UPI00398FCA4E